MDQNKTRDDADDADKDDAPLPLRGFQPRTLRRPSVGRRPSVQRRSSELLAGKPKSCEETGEDGG